MSRRPRRCSLLRASASAALFLFFFRCFRAGFSAFSLVAGML
jgi:hypothetical protein